MKSPAMIAQLFSIIVDPILSAISPHLHAGGRPVPHVLQETPKQRNIELPGVDGGWRPGPKLQELPRKAPGQLCWHRIPGMPFSAFHVHHQRLPALVFVSASERAGEPDFHDSCYLHRGTPRHVTMVIAVIPCVF